MLIIMGTSLKVHGLKKMVKEFAKAVHRHKTSQESKVRTWTGKVIFVNKTPPASEWAEIIDYHVAGETDVWANKVIDDWKKARPADWEVQQKLVAVPGDIAMGGAFKQVKENVTAKLERKGKWSWIVLITLLKPGTNLIQSPKMLLLFPFRAKMFPPRGASAHLSLPANVTKPLPITTT
jgi:hypothetical protein